MGRFKRLIILGGAAEFALVAVAARAAAPAQTLPIPAAAAGEPGIVGTWRLVKFEDRKKDGSVDRLYGENPRGYLTYDSSGHLSVHIMKMPFLAPPASGTLSDADKARAYDAYVGYFGTYTVDSAKKVVTHQVEGSLTPFYTETAQPRHYTLTGDLFVIDGTDPNDGTVYYREFHRVR